MKPAPRPYIGGQAVLEGVMMRAPTSFAIVVRRRDGALHVRERAALSESTGVRRWPFVRGVLALVDSLRMAREALQFSIEQMETDWAAAGPAVTTLLALGLALVGLATRADVEAPVPPGAARRSSGGSMLIVAPMILFLVALPQAAAATLNRVMHWGLSVQGPTFQALTGGFKLAVVVGYVLAMRAVPDVRRMFQYHGAEHKTISTYEAGEALTVDNARAKTTLHARCGTTFLVMVALVSIVVFAVVGQLLPRIATGSVVLDNVVFFLEKLPFLPPMVAVTFELQRLFARYCTTGPLRVLLWPGFLVQKITTLEPDDAQLEVALASLRVTLFRSEGAAVRAPAKEARFPTYAALLAAESLDAGGAVGAVAAE